MIDIGATASVSTGHDQMARHGALEIQLDQLTTELAAIDRTAAACPWVDRLRLKAQRWIVSERIEQTRARMRAIFK